ncbi:hypothetical protein DRO03_05325 [Methanosarcinales archaeon]|nr:MAG: hypothetical protein DRO03_05325 [Methanosarcinales archaeon]
MSYRQPLCRGVCLQPEYSHDTSVSSLHDQLKTLSRINHGGVPRVSCSRGKNQSYISRQTSGFIEGLNNKIKVIKRRCYGIFNVKHLFQSIYLDMEGYSLFT